MAPISVVIPTHGRRPTLSRVLERLAAQSVAANSFEVILVSDAAAAQPERAARQLRESGLRGEHLIAPAPGASAARNVGWRAARGELILFLDDDVLPDPALITEHLAGHAAEPDEATGVLGDVRWASELRVTTFMRWVEQDIQFDYSSLSAGEDARWYRLYTANASLKRSALERVSGFDEQHFPFGYEDLDLAKRIYDAIGLRLRYRPAASAEHLHAMYIEEWRERVKRIALAERQFVARHPELSPHFHGLFANAAAQPPAQGRLARLAPLISPRVPLLGARVWTSVHWSFLQDLAPHFLSAWERAGAEGDGQREGA